MYSSGVSVEKTPELASQAMARRKYWRHALDLPQQGEPLDLLASEPKAWAFARACQRRPINQRKAASSGIRLWTAGSPEGSPRDAARVGCRWRLFGNSRPA